MGIAEAKERMRTPPALMQLAALGFVLLGSIIGWATLDKDGPGVGKEVARLHTFFSIFCVVLVLAITLFDMAHLYPVALGLYLSVIGNLIADIHSFVENGRLKGAAAGFSFVAIGMLAGFLSLFPLHRLPEIPSAALATPRNRLGTGVVALNGLACILLWAHADEGGANLSYEVIYGIYALINIFIFSASYFGEHILSFHVTLLWFSYIQTDFLSLALKPYQPEKKKSLYIAAFVLAWLGTLAMLAVNLLFPPPGVVERWEEERRGGVAGVSREAFDSGSGGVTVAAGGGGGSGSVAGGGSGSGIMQHEDPVPATDV